MSKIIATISPITENLEGIGMGRINGAFGSKDDIAALAKRIKRDMKVPVLLDLPRSRKKKRTNSLKDEDFIDIAEKVGIEFLGLSYVCSANEVKQIRRKIRSNKIKLISKIESKEAESDLDNIISVSDGIMIDRGDLANAVGIEKLPRLQKKIINKCIKYGKMVIVATEMLTSMINDTKPTKAEVLDIANAVSDGADYVMLSEETAIGRHPAHVVKTMKMIIDEVSERYKVIILAAGSGSGLGALTAKHHVCLTDIGGKTILDVQLDALKKNGVYEEDIIVATGKGDSEIRKKLKDTDINIVFNPWYDTTNMMTTIWLAKDLIQQGFIVVYGDIVFENEIIRRILKNPSDIVLAVEKKITDDEDEKICVKRKKMVLHSKYESLLYPKHKCIPKKDAYGEFLGIAKFNRQGAIILGRIMDDLLRQRKFETYLVSAFEQLVAIGYSLHVEEMSGLLWNDNDTVYDIEKTKHLFPEIIKRNKST